MPGAGIANTCRISSIGNGAGLPSEVLALHAAISAKGQGPPFSISQTIRILSCVSDSWKANKNVLLALMLPVVFAVWFELLKKHSFPFRCHHILSLFHHGLWCRIVLKRACPPFCFNHLSGHVQMPARRGEGPGAAAGGGSRGCQRPGGARAGPALEEGAGARGGLSPDLRRRYSRSSSGPWGALDGLRGSSRSDPHFESTPDHLAEEKRGCLPTSSLESQPFPTQFP